MKHWIVAMLLALSAMPAAWAQDYMKAFPPAEAGMVRHVLQLPERDDESAVNSRLPVVVYVPEGVEVRYRIWSAGPGLETMGPG